MPLCSLASPFHGCILRISCATEYLEVHRAQLIYSALIITVWCCGGPWNDLFGTFRTALVSRVVSRRIHTHQAITSCYLMLVPAVGSSLSKTSMLANRQNRWQCRCHSSVRGLGRACQIWYFHLCPDKMGAIALRFWTSLVHCEENTTRHKVIWTQCLSSVLPPWRPSICSQGDKLRWYVGVLMLFCSNQMSQCAPRGAESFYSRTNFMNQCPLHLADRGAYTQGSSAMECSPYQKRGWTSTLNSHHHGYGTALFLLSCRLVSLTIYL